ncbi:hypothetical protein KVR01_011220 [Diaporthe batatas]|uniref:uncharacterized protein n=1 Tax=Diaporthe batatas TaxID=748121 RepID=UPI001D041269|nr:uncharacterized protein KVR01_011220 [Diaporthe batatas]KAG8158777.1 hypothetical protein KVR01_011220 [Diaporthe batatas]
MQGGHLLIFIREDTSSHSRFGLSLTRPRQLTPLSARAVSSPLPFYRVLTIVNRLLNFLRNPTVMETPPEPPKRIVRVAAQLGDLPVELVEPVLKDLGLWRVLQLSNTPLALEPESRLRGILENSRSWGSVFRLGNDRPQRICASLNHLAWAWNRQVVHRVDFLESSNLFLTPDELVRIHGSNFGPPVIKDLEVRFMRGFRQLLRVPGHNDEEISGLTEALLRAICRFIPFDALEAIETNNHTELLHALRTPDVVNGNDNKCTVAKLHDHARDWDVQQLQAFLPVFLYAFNSLNQAKSEQLLRLADLYDWYPRWLKVPLGPQDPAPRNNLNHISDLLRSDARRIASRMALSRQVPRDSRTMNWYRFRFPHPALIPTNKALHLFALSRNLKFPPSLTDDVRRASDGLWYIYEQDGKRGQVRCVRDKKTLKVRHRVHTGGRCADTSPIAELEWLESFLRCVSWASINPGTVSRRLLESTDYQQYIEDATENAHLDILADQLLEDFKISRNESRGRPHDFPSLTALFMPPFSSWQTRGVATRMWPEMADDEIRRIYWEESVSRLKRYLAKAPQVPEHEDGAVLACDASPDQQGLDDATKAFVAASALKKPGKGAQPRCYICRLENPQPHKIFAAMCGPCGEFNLAGSSASLPQHLRLEGKTALVTGARINLGFHVVLRLLRCGASVIASTRYPRDAVARYKEQPDAADWMDRLRVVGADFRTANDAFGLIRQTKSILQEWDSGLDILINNAAQTLTDSVGMEETAVARENSLKGTSMPMLAQGSYEARVWQGAAASNTLREASPEDKAREKTATAQVPGKDAASETLGLESLAVNQHTDEAKETVTDAIIKRPGPSSWVQSLSEIPYDDVITAHSINTFVPLILIRELLPSMDHRKGANTGHVVNVSSREGIFEDKPRHGAKGGKHVHTNMSKAGLNMITETEASTAWKKYRVCMNTVDPGYMSAAPEFEDAYGGERPLSWEDGAGRVLWPIAMAEGGRGLDREKGKIGAFWGRFLKHYGAVRVDTRLGRG